MATLSLRIPDALSDQLGSLSRATGRTKTFLALQAIKSFVEQEAWQIAEIKKGLSEADAGDFATEEEMKALDEKWGFRED